jgi:hypothetical protein
MGYSVSYKDDETRSSFSSKQGKNDQSSPNKIRRLNGTIETTANGFLSIPHDQWNKLTDDDKAFVQKYNSKVKLQESVSTLPVPAGVTIKSKARRNHPPDVDTVEEDDSSSVQENESPSKKQKTRKKVQFSVQPDAEE